MKAIHENQQFPLALLERLRQARFVVAMTGAGISAESGVPTFRDAQTGLWAKYRPEDLATPEAFRRDPVMVWRWYAMRRAKVRTVQPNPGHYALVELGRRYPQFTLVTQNVDGLHQRAGSQPVLELHGNITRVKCFAQHHPVTEWPEAAQKPPPCPKCGSPLRPDVVWFGEMLPEAELRAAEAAAGACDVFLSIGTSAVVYPAAGLADAAREAGAMVVEINPAETPLSGHAHHCLRGPSGTVLPALVRAFQTGS